MEMLSTDSTGWGTCASAGRIRPRGAVEGVGRVARAAVEVTEAGVWVEVATVEMMGMASEVEDWKGAVLSGETEEGG
eukprot:2585788-Prymnesium_polylepis.1